MCKIVYLAGPYSDPDPVVRRTRFWKLTEEAARMCAEGLCVYSPITLTHPIELVLQASPHLKNPGYEFWVETFDKEYMERCGACVVLKLPGWERSKGVAYEIDYFTKASKPVLYVEPDSDWKTILRARILMECID